MPTHRRIWCMRLSRILPLKGCVSLCLFAGFMWLSRLGRVLEGHTIRTKLIEIMARAGGHGGRACDRMRCQNDAVKYCACISSFHSALVKPHWSSLEVVCSFLKKKYVFLKIYTITTSFKESLCCHSSPLQWSHGHRFVMGIDVVILALHSTPCKSMYIYKTVP